MRASGQLAGGIVLAFIAVILVAFFVGCGSIIIPYGIPHRPDDVEATFLIGLMTAIATVPFALVSALVVGLPIFHILARRGARSVLPYLAAGLLMSAFLAFAVILSHLFADFLDGGDDFRIALWIIGLGGPVVALSVRVVCHNRI